MPGRNGTGPMGMGQMIGKDYLMIFTQTLMAKKIK